MASRSPAVAAVTSRAYSPLESTFDTPQLYELNPTGAITTLRREGEYILLLK